MTLLDIRKAFIQHSGRYDLVSDSTTYADNGANFFIKAGQKVLDNKVNISENDMLSTLPTVANEELVRIPGIRTIEGIWIEDSETGHSFLREAFLNDFKEAFADNVSTGLPTHYTIIPLRKVSADKEDLTEVGIRLGPKPNKEYDLHILGRWFSHPLSDNEDKNFWSINYPHTLIQAALYSIERFYRNTQGMNDHMAAIEEDLQGIDFEQVEREQRIRTNMADSFNERIHQRLYRGF